VSARMPASANITVGQTRFSTRRPTSYRHQAAITGDFVPKEVADGSGTSHQGSVGSLDAADRRSITATDAGTFHWA